MTLVTWNVNSVRQRLPRLLALLARHRPDIVCLQETKVADEAFPFGELARAGYSAAVHGQAGYNGVAILSRTPPTAVRRGFPGDPCPDEARAIVAEIPGLTVASLYVINGRAVGSERYLAKLSWLEALAAWIREERLAARPVVVAGDFNVAPDDRDVHDPALWEGKIMCSEPERERLRALLDLGLVDLLRRHTDAGGVFTWWDYRAGAFHRGWGLRIDLALGSAPIAARVAHAAVDRDERKPTFGEGKPSDHAPVVITWTEATMGVRTIMRALVTFALLTTMVACGGDDRGETEAASTTGATIATSEATSTRGPTTSTTIGIPTPTTGESPDDNEADEVDLLTYGAGAFPIRVGAGSEAAVRTALDGIPNHATIDRIDTRLDFVVELPAETTFETFGIPLQSGSGCCYGKHVKTVIVEGSNRSPDDGFAELASFVVDMDVEGPQLFNAETRVPVRWVRVTFEGRQTPYESDHDPTGFTELLGYGSQAAVEVGPDAFTGLWLTGGGGSGPDGNRIELFQDGALITGCGVSGAAEYSVSGGIENGLAKLRFRGDHLTTVAVVNSENQLSGALIGRSFTRLVGEPGGSPTPCSPGREPPPNPVAEALDAGEPAIIYGINFDVDSDRLRPDAEPALNQILAALRSDEGRSVTIEGHTDADDSDARNLDLSQRRAQSVVHWLVGKGIDVDRLTPVGKGEAEPIADNGTAAGKAANRRVEVESSS